MKIAKKHQTNNCKRLDKITPLLLKIKKNHKRIINWSPVFHFVKKVKYTYDKKFIKVRMRLARAGVGEYPPNFHVEGNVPTNHFRTNL